ncbi:hypothetical protein KKH23_01270 [Patescibacteria group bacterium]|nr:hypothetical protein [Patescibacteria group bacterium]MBU0777122.1 hypothetical protein [Patescibacteria group bacterium]MBU0845816.1 hypothetical protein [Patescibacteria group bacterium]MBU0922843.1 hypothetical protein [Patescibacteria group bacterium]MBU1066424.1 hypothetical protein [Patescibacteria group bacterium]
MSEKTVGYILLFVGVIIILFSGFSVYGVFSKNIKPVQFFSIGSTPIEIPIAGQTANKGVDGGGIGIPTEVIQDPLNAFAHLTLMIFIGGVGFKIASLGTMLIRPVIVKLKSKESSDKPSK